MSSSFPAVAIAFSKEESGVVMEGVQSDVNAMKSKMLDPISKLLRQNEDVQPRVPFGLGHGSMVASFNTERGQSIMVLCCDVSELDVDAIISPTDPNLSCSGGLSNLIAEEGM